MTSKQYALLSIACGVIALVLALTGGCTWLHSKPGQAIIDCTGLDRQTLTAEGAALLALVPDWQAIEQRAVADAEHIGWKAAGCALAEVTQAFLSKPQGKADETWSAHDALERFRQAHLDGATLHTADGDL